MLQVKAEFLVANNLSEPYNFNFSHIKLLLILQKSAY